MCPAPPHVPAAPPPPQEPRKGLVGATPQRPPVPSMRLTPGGRHRSAAPPPCAAPPAARGTRRAACRSLAGGRCRGALRGQIRTAEVSLDWRKAHWIDRSRRGVTGGAPAVCRRCTKREVTRLQAPGVVEDERGREAAGRGNTWRVNGASAARACRRDGRKGCAVPQ
eukprot:352850-Chlamydomonas_euryale.AAC.10